jgi:hypothetical protein
LKQHIKGGGKDKKKPVKENSEDPNKNNSDSDSEADPERKKLQEKLTGQFQMCFRVKMLGGKWQKWKMEKCHYVAKMFFLSRMGG